jgi:hypothetical protein
MPGRLDPKSTGQTRHCQSQFAAQLKVPSRPVAMLASPGREVDIWFCGTLQTSPLQQPGLEEMMSPCARTFASAAALVVFSAVAAAQTTLDPAFVGFKLPDQIAWKDNQSGSRTAPQGDPSKTGPYHRPAAMAAGKDEPAAVHPNDRFFIVVSGTWWVGSGPEFKPDAPCRWRQAATSSITRRASISTAPRTSRPPYSSGAKGPRRPHRSARRR